MDGFFDFFELRTEERILTDIRILGLDIETTGLDVSANEIIELGIASYDPSSGGIDTVFQSYVHPNQPLKEHITKITGIDEPMLEGAPSIGDISREVTELISGSLLVIHNADFDIPFLQRHIAADILSGNDAVVFDTLKFSRKLLHSSRYSLEFLIESLGLNHENHHRAADDARMCLQLFDHLLKLRPDFRSMVVSDILKIVQ